MIEKIFAIFKRPKLQEIVGIRVGKERFLINESVSDDDGEIPTQTYLYRPYSNFLKYNRETTRQLITTPGVLQGYWNREGSLRRLDVMDDAENLERAFLEGNRIKLNELRRLT